MKSHRSSWILALCALALVLTSACDKNKDKPAAGAESASAGAEMPDAPKPTGEVLATVNGVDIYTDEFLQAARRLPPTSRSGLMQPDNRKKFFEDFVEDKLLYIEAKSRGLQNDEDVARRINEYAERVTIQALRREIQRSPVDDAKIEEYYNANIEEFTQKRGRFSMILKRRPPNRTPEDDKRIESEIKAIYKQLQGGGDFAAIAKKESQEPRSAQVGGDMGFVDLSRWSARVQEEGEKLKVGETSQPFEVGYGWIILRRTEKEKTITAPLSEVKPRIAQRMRVAAVDTFKEDLRGNAKVDVNDKLLYSLDLGMGGARAGAPKVTVSEPDEAAKPAEAEAEAEAEAAPAEGGAEH